MQNFIKTFQAVEPFSEFGPRQSLDEGQMAFDNPLASSCQYQCACNISSSHCSTRFKRYGYLHFFRIWSSAKPRPTLNVILQPLELDLVNINVYAKVYQNIPNGLRAVGIFRELSGISQTDRGRDKCDYRAHSESQP